MYISFAVNAWSAIAAGILNRAHWLDWASAPWSPTGEFTPSLPDFPSLHRRRLSRLGKLAVAVASDASGSTAPETLPIVWASRYGDASRSLAMLAERARGEPVSPTAFAVSVHNGIGAQYSICKKITQNASSLAAGSSTVEAGLIEAAALLAEGHREVLLVHYDAPLPEPFSRFHDAPAAEYAWAFRITQANPQDPAGAFSLRAERSPPPNLPPPCLPHGLEILRALLTGTPYLHPRQEGGCWNWSPLHA